MRAATRLGVDPDPGSVLIRKDSAQFSAWCQASANQKHDGGDVGHAPCWKRYSTRRQEWREARPAARHDFTKTR